MSEIRRYRRQKNSKFLDVLVFAVYACSNDAHAHAVPRLQKDLHLAAPAEKAASQLLLSRHDPPEVSLEVIKACFCLLSFYFCLEEPLNDVIHMNQRKFLVLVEIEHSL